MPTCTLETLIGPTAFFRQVTYAPYWSHDEWVRGFHEFLTELNLSKVRALSIPLRSLVVSVNDHGTGTLRSTSLERRSAAFSPCTTLEPIPPTCSRLCCATPSVTPWALNRAPCVSACTAIVAITEFAWFPLPWLDDARLY